MCGIFACHQCVAYSALIIRPRHSPPRCTELGVSTNCGFPIVTPMCKSSSPRLCAWPRRDVRHRGPDWSGNFIGDQTSESLHAGNVVSRLTMVSRSPRARASEHRRCRYVLPRRPIEPSISYSNILSFLDSGAQPLVNDDETLALAVNGEIYNHRILRKNLHTKYNFKTHSDCEVIIPLYMEHGLDAPKYLDGMFSWVLWDKKQDRVIAARDPIGITSFYLGRSSTTPGAVYFASELKCLHPVCDNIIAFPPGHVYDSTTDKLTRYFEPKWWDPTNVPSTPVDLKVLRTTLEKSVRKRLMAEVPYGVLLSGGLDSSLVAAIAQRETLRMQEAAKKTNASSEDLVGIDDNSELSSLPFFQQLHSFSIGLPGAPDTAAAMEVAKFLGTKHHAFTFTVEDGLNALSDVVYHLETYDVTTIRASTPMYLLSRKIKAMGVKMVLSGEGSDEIFGGYLYFHAAPNREEFHKETVRRVKNLHLADCLRANKSTSAWGLEARVPFLDKEFLETSMAIDPKDKMIDSEHIEKYILRKAFDTSDEPDAAPYLPEKILWRQKEQFSDGVGYSWIDGLKDAAEAHVTDEMMKNPKPEWGTDVPDTKEAYWYRTMFDEHFPLTVRVLSSAGPLPGPSRPIPVEGEFHLAFQGFRHGMTLTLNVDRLPTTTKSTSTSSKKSFSKL
ncbi:asparagine synthetase Asn2 [Penicillium atrosanguineum]|nr:asparagine synthetase Asn2 [Penicillium atrosanguineum]